MGLFSDKTNDDRDRAQPLAYSVQRPLTASAQRVHLDDKSEIERFKQRKIANSWQTEAWEYFDAIGEIKYSGILIGAILSRVRLYPAYNHDPDQAPAHIKDSAALATIQLPDNLANDCDRVLRRLDSANGGMGGLLNRAGVNVWVAGECWLVQTPPDVFKQLPERWDIKSIDELEVGSSGKLSLKPTRTTKSGLKENELPLNAFAGRIWRSHARYSDEADSSIRSIRDLADELLLLGRTAKATARSRLNAGALYLPDGLSLAADADEDADVDPDGVITDVEDETDSFEQELVDAMTTPIQDEESAAAVVPLIIRGPAELADKIKQFKFERSFDGELVKRGADVLERIMHGLDIPKNVVMGMANVKYSNAVQIDEQLYKAHVEPLILLICDALTEVYYRPALRVLGYEEEFVRKALVWYDPSEILTRPDRAKSANEGHDRKALSNEAWRRAQGYSETDAPTADELIKRAVLDRGPITPEIATAILKIIAPTLLGEVREASQAASPVPPLSPQAQEILNGQPDTPTPTTGNPETQPLVPPSPPTPTTPTPVVPQPPRPGPGGVVQ